LVKKHRVKGGTGGGAFVFCGDELGVSELGVACGKECEDVENLEVKGRDVEGNEVSGDCASGGQSHLDGPFWGFSWSSRGGRGGKWRNHMKTQYSPASSYKTSAGEIVKEAKPGRKI